ncbi:hypothetical protein BMR05_13260 [Methylococcaceae bacterium HT4]|nr:hypothetical protein BMR05_13260 [Methylococcaceae bacterium HT4]
MIAGNVGEWDLCDGTITGHKKQLTIEVALGIMDRHYEVVKMQAHFEILNGNPSLLRCAYDDFLKAIEEQTKN